MFIAVPLLIARNWKQPRYPLTEEWIKKVLYRFTVKYYSAVKRYGVIKFADKCIELGKNNTERGNPDSKIQM